MNRFQEFYTYHPVTFVILALNTIMMLFVMFDGGFNVENLIGWGAIYPPFVKDGQYYRLLTATALHGSIIHYFFNSYVLYFLGTNMEKMIGPLKFGFVYVISGLISSVAVVYLGEQNIVTIGASGAIFGIMGGILMLSIRKKSWFNPRGIQSIRTLVVINLIFTFTIPNISIPGHIGGLVAGILLFLLISPDKPYYLKYIEQIYDYHE
jgi:rhomboid protease GluP